MFSRVFCRIPFETRECFIDYNVKCLKHFSNDNILYWADLMLLFRVLTAVVVKEVGSNPIVV